MRLRSNSRPCSEIDRVWMALAPAAILVACSESGSAAPGGSAAAGGDAAEAGSRCEAVLDSEIPVAVVPASRRIDLVEPTFSNPTNITNPLWPVGIVESDLSLGHVDQDVPLRVEKTLMIETRLLDYKGRPVELAISQFVAYHERRIAEGVVDYYAQADDGSVWYFGEDVFNYEEGVVVDTEGSWLACKDGPAAMFMPANPRVGDVYRTENAYPLVFEETTVKALDQTLEGPGGPISGVMTAEENHTLEGIVEDKVYAPGYGEFTTDVEGDLEQIALAVPTDALPSPAPAELRAVTLAASNLFEAALFADWSRASSIRDTLTTSWGSYQAGQVPLLLREQMGDALAALGDAITEGDAEALGQAAIDVRQASLDLELRYRPRVAIDFARLDLWAMQLVLDASVADTGGVGSDATILEWVWPRVSHASGDGTSRIETELAAIRSAADRADSSGASNAAQALRDILSQMGVAN